MNDEPPVPLACPQIRRSQVAVALAAAFGVPIGIFLYTTAVPFGPVLIGWGVALAGSLAVPVVFCFLAERRYFLVDVGYSAGVAGSTIIAALILPRSNYDWWGPLVQFATVFVIVSVPSVLVSGLCALLKWEDKKARQKVAALNRTRRETSR
jgi:hypothetical protein